jgi:hypothetical protein
VHLQEVVTGAGSRQLQKVETNHWMHPPRRIRTGVRGQIKESGGRLMVRLDALACGACLDELVDGRRQPRPPQESAGESQGLVAESRPKWPPRGVECSSVSTVRRVSELARCRDTQVVAAALRR